MSKNLLIDCANRYQSLAYKLRKDFETCTYGYNRHIRGLISGGGTEYQRIIMERHGHTYVFTVCYDVLSDYGVKIISTDDEFIPYINDKLASTLKAFEDVRTEYRELAVLDKLSN